MSSIMVQPSSNRFNAIALVVCIWLLMVFTFSPPEDWKQGLYGTQTILPPSLIKLLKLCSRALAMCILAFLVFRQIRKPDSGRIALFFFPAAVFVFWILTSVYWSALRAVSLQQAVSFTISIVLAYAFAFSWTSKKDTSLYFLNVSIVLLMISTVLVTLYVIAPSYGALTKAASGMFHSTTAGASASLGIVCIVGVFGIYRWMWSRVLILPSLAIHITVLILAGNRFSIILTAIFVVIVVLYFFRKHEIALVSTAIAIIGLGYLAIDPKLNGPDFAIQKTEKYVLQGQSTVQLKTISGRTEMWRKMWNSFLKSPWIGHGYFVTSRTGRIFVWDEWGNWTAHNMYLQVMVTTGLIGMFLFLVSMAVPMAGLVQGQLQATAIDSPLLALLFIIGSWFMVWGGLNSSVVGPTQPETVVFAIVYGLGARTLSDAWVYATKVQ